MTHYTHSLFWEAQTVGNLMMGRVSWWCFSIIFLFPFLSLFLPSSCSPTCLLHFFLPLRLSSPFLFVDFLLPFFFSCSCSTFCFS
ncbi:hypothetical protein F5Y07DRAFT_261377 [Xylaria sp. FL0933]|nr:hypothetical protein F5Y07DRAFT_261377 [Xylaria sp. FL0933]